MVKKLNWDGLGLACSNEVNMAEEDADPDNQFEDCDTVDEVIKSTLRRLNSP